MDAQLYLMPLLVAFAVAMMVTPLVIRLAVAIAIVDRPSARSVNQRLNVPLMGGMAVGLGFAAGLAVALRQLDPEIPTGHLLAIGLGGLLVLASGVYDDRFGMDAKTKFTIQLIAAALAIFSGYEIGHITEPFTGTTFILPVWISWTVTAVWIVMITNALNLVDGLDGLATGVAAIIAATLAFIAGESGQAFGVCVGVALFGALLGFLPFNFAPARIFLGDTGALFIGYILSLLALEGYRQVSLLTFVVPILALAVPILDTGLSVIRRIKNRAPIFTADRQHIHHRLLETEGSARGAVLQFYLLTAAFCLISVAFSRLRGPLSVGLFLIAVAVLTSRLVSNLDALSTGSAARSGAKSVDAEPPENTLGTEERES